MVAQRQRAALKLWGVTVLHSTALYCALPCHTMGSYCTVLLLYCSALHSERLKSAVLCCATLVRRGGLPEGFEALGGRKGSTQLA